MGVWMWLWLGCAVAAPDDAGTAPRAKVEQTQTPLATLALDEGVFRFVSSRGAPNDIYTVRGKLTAKVFADYVLVTKANSETGVTEIHLAPREMVVYLGTWQLD